MPPILTAMDTKGTCHLAYDAVQGESYAFSDRVVWDVLYSVGTWTTGFKAILIRPRSARKDVIVLAFAGSDSLLDALVDIDQATGGLPAQYHQALALTKRFQSQYRNLYLTGHSLGGGLAAYSSVMTKLPASTINPAPLVGALTMDAFKGNSQITNYVPREGEFVSSSPGRNPGIDIEVNANTGLPIIGAFTRHMVGNVMPEIMLPQRASSGASGSW